MTVSEQIKSYEASRETKRVRMDAIMAKSAEAGTTLDAADSEEYDTLEGEVASINKHVERLQKLEAVNVASAKPVDGTTQQKATDSRGGHTPVITVRDNLPPGVGFARAVLCGAASYLEHRPVAEIAKQRYPEFSALQQHFEQKAAVPAGTATQAVWGGPLVYATNLESEFVEFLRPQTIVGRLPSLTRVPFNVRIPSQTGGGTGYWVGEGAPKPLTSFAFSSSTIATTKVAAIAVITQELARFSSPSADMLTRNALAAALVERIDIDFIDPAEAAVSGVKPASITYGLVARTSAGTSADNARTDLGSLLNVFLSANLNPASLALIMPNTLAMALSLMVNSLGQPEFPGLSMNGGTLMGIPVITSQYAANASGGGNLVIAVNQSDIFLADDGQVTVDASTEASLQMSDAPTNNASTGTGQSVVSMYQTNSIALRAERFISWAKRRSDAVVYLDDVNWGSVGSPS